MRSIHFLGLAVSAMVLTAAVSAQAASETSCIGKIEIESYSGTTSDTVRGYGIHFIEGRCITSLSNQATAVGYCPASLGVNVYTLPTKTLPVTCGDGSPVRHTMDGFADVPGLLCSATVQWKYTAYNPAPPVTTGTSSVTASCFPKNPVAQIASNTSNVLGQLVRVRAYGVDQENGLAGGTVAIGTSATAATYDTPQ